MAKIAAIAASDQSCGGGVICGVPHAARAASGAGRADIVAGSKSLKLIASAVPFASTTKMNRRKPSPTAIVFSSAKLNLWPQFGHGFGKGSGMNAPRIIQGTGEVFSAGQNLGTADYRLTVFTSPRGKGADGTLVFAEGSPRQFPHPSLTIAIGHGVTFKVVVTRHDGETVMVSSDGPVPGL